MNQNQEHAKSNRAPAIAAIGLLAATGAVSLAARGGGEPVQSNTPAIEQEQGPNTTIVNAQHRDTLWSLQQAEGDSGRDIGEVVHEAAGLNENGAVVRVGEPVVLIDDPSTPKHG